MRSGATPGHHRLRHETAFYDSDDDLVAIVVPFIEGGATAGEATIVALAEPEARLVRASITDVEAVTFLAGNGQYARPATAIRLYRDRFRALVASGATRIRAVGTVPHPGLGQRWDWWARYEAAVSHAFDELPLWALCPYDVRITPDYVLDDVTRTHAHVALPDGRHLPNHRFEEPAAFLGRCAPPLPDPLELLEPRIDLRDPTPTAARAATELLCAAVGLDASSSGDLVIAVSEAVANAWQHGRSPVRLRLWADELRVVASVSDAGPGPVDPFAGLLPVSAESVGGRGLWLMHQLCDHVALNRGAEGFTVRLTAGRIPGTRPVSEAAGAHRCG